MRAILQSLLREYKQGNSSAIRLLQRDLRAFAPSSSSSSSSPPVVMVSACLLGNKVNYRGGSSGQKPSNPIHFIRNTLSAPVESVGGDASPPHLVLFPYCPEVQLLGLPVPRPPMRLWRRRVPHASSVVSHRHQRGVLINSTTHEPIIGEGGAASQASAGPSPVTASILAERMEAHKRHLSSTLQCKGFILKARSPSCGVGDARAYDEPEGGTYEETDGFYVNDVVMPVRVARLAAKGAAAQEGRADVVTERSIRDEVILLDFLEHVLGH